MKTSDNIYQLDGRVPLLQALPFGLQHVLAMFVSNITPIIILANVVGIEKGHPELHDYRKHRHAHPALPCLENRLPPPHRHGHQFHIPLRLHFHRSIARHGNAHGRRHRWRYCRRTSRPLRQILAQAHPTHRRRHRRDLHRIFAFAHRREFIRGRPRCR